MQYLCWSGAVTSEHAPISGRQNGYAAGVYLQPLSRPWRYEQRDDDDAKNSTNFAFVSQGSLGPPGIPGVDGLKVSKLIYTEFLESSTLLGF